MEEITHHFGAGASGHGQQHHHHPWGSALSAVVAPLPHLPQSTGLPLTLNTAAAGNSGANGSGSNPVLQLASGASLLDVCVKATEPSSSSSYGADIEAIKAKIISHPHYYSLLAAYLECQKAIPVPVAAAAASSPAREVSPTSDAKHGACRLSACFYIACYSVCMLPM
uniref:Kn1 n=1 Tax=Arundo donax TaxID=35708 RepID=A0A0A9FZP9_ARUDO